MLLKESIDLLEEKKIKNQQTNYSIINSICVDMFIRSIIYIDKIFDKKDKDNKKSKQYAALNFKGKI